MDLYQNVDPVFSPINISVLYVIIDTFTGYKDELHAQSGRR